MVEKHFLDSLTLLPVIRQYGLDNEMNSHASLLDVGTGAGFPGLVLAAALPELDVTLVEPRQKRVFFLCHIIRTLGLTNVQTIRADAATLDTADPYGALRLKNPDACCDLRKSQVLNAALTGYDAWITGRKRHQAAPRSGLNYFDLDEATGKIKINPLIDWKPARIAAHLDRFALPRHPLVADGFKSIGCKPCTTRVADGEDPRAGRWRGLNKTECGLHRPTHPKGDLA